MDRAEIQDALDYCLVNPDNLSAEELLAKFPEHREELGPLLALSTRVEAVSPPPVSAERRAAMKARVQAAASTLRPTQPVPVVPISPAQEAQIRPWDFQLPVTWIGAAAAALILALVWWGASASLPDSPFYSVKLASENLLLNLSGSPTQSIRSHANLANVRLFDVKAMSERNRLEAARPALENYSYHLNSSVTGWRQTSGQTRTDLAKVLYTSSLAGRNTFLSVEGVLPNLPPSIQENIRETVAAIDALNTDTTQALQSAGIDISEVVGQSPSNIAALLTPEPAVVAALQTRTAIASVPIAPTSPPVATAIGVGATQTAIAAAGTVITPPVMGPGVEGTPSTTPTSAATATPLTIPTPKDDEDVKPTKTPRVRGVPRATQRPPVPTTVAQPPPHQTPPGHQNTRVPPDPPRRPEPQEEKEKKEKKKEQGGPDKP